MLPHDGQLNALGVPLFTPRTFFGRISTVRSPRSLPRARFHPASAIVGIHRHAHAHTDLKRFVPSPCGGM